MNLRELTKRYGRGIGLSINAVGALGAAGRAPGVLAPCPPTTRRSCPPLECRPIAAPLRTPPPLPLPRQVRVYAQQMLVALYHLRNCGVLHADIKPDNIL